ncbi:MAG: YafY family transcriptional regulator [Burkholderiales bacterium]|uniref:helix-turn-helix transcriptional regulator n=1 Tax=Limnobacter sp. TaxID=2003368 RepID=UPI0039BCF2E6|nr:YafY family transcriptional regulator [Burkholderiales bacterium]
MNQIERVYKIDRLLQAKPRSAIELQDELEVSPATLKRDLEYMRSRLYAPIVFDRSIAAYKLDNSLPESHRYALPGMWFSAAEIHALLALQHLIHELEPSGFMQPHIQPLAARLEKLLDDQKTTSETIRKRIHIIGLGKRIQNPTFFEKIGFSLINRLRLKIRYRARSTAETTQREISPLRLIHYRENWYLDAWCHTRNAVRNFSVDAIEQLEILEIPAIHIELDPAETSFGKGYGIFSGKEIKTAKLRFSPIRARWVANEQWHPHQNGSFDETGHFVLELPYADPRELTMDILKHGPDCEVIHPPELRKHVFEQIKAMQKKYSG